MYEKEIKEVGKYKFTVHDLKQNRNSIVSSILFLADSKYENKVDYIQAFYPKLLDFLKQRDKIKNINQEFILKKIDNSRPINEQDNMRISDTITGSYVILGSNKVSLLPKIILENFNFNSNLYTYDRFYLILIDYYEYIGYNLAIKDNVEKLKSKDNKGDQELYQKIMEVLKKRDSIKNEKLFFYNLIQEKIKKYIDYTIYIDFITDMLKINIIIVDDTLKTTKGTFFTKNKNLDDKFIILMSKNNSFSPVTSNEKKIFSISEDKEIYHLFITPDTSIDEILEKEKNKLPTKKSIKNIVDELEISED